MGELRTRVFGFFLLFLVASSHGIESARRAESGVRSLRTGLGVARARRAMFGNAGEDQERRPAVQEDHLAHFDSDVVESLVDLLVQVHLDDMEGEDFWPWSSSGSPTPTPTPEPDEPSRWDRIKAAAVRRIESAKETISEKVDDITEVAAHVRRRAGEVVDDIGDTVSDAWDDLTDWTQEQADSIRSAAREVLNDAMAGIKSHPQYQSLRHMGRNIKHVVDMMVLEDGASGTFSPGTPGGTMGPNGERIAKNGDYKIGALDILSAVAFGLFNGLLAGLGDVFRDAINHPSCDRYARDVSFSFSQLIKAVDRSTRAVFTSDNILGLDGEPMSRRDAVKTSFDASLAALDSLAMFVYKCDPVFKLIGMTVLVLAIAIGVTMALIATGFGIVVKVAQVILTLVFSVQFLFKSVQKLADNMAACLGYQCSAREALSVIEAGFEIVGVFVGAFLLSGIDKLLKVKNLQNFFKSGTLKGTSVKWNPSFKSEVSVFLTRLKALKARGAEQIASTTRKVGDVARNVRTSIKEMRTGKASTPKGTLDDIRSSRPVAPRQGPNSLAGRTDGHKLTAANKDASRIAESSARRTQAAIDADVIAQANLKAAKRNLDAAKQAGNADEIARAQGSLDAAKKAASVTDNVARSTLKAHVQISGDMDNYLAALGKAGIKYNKHHSKSLEAIAKMNKLVVDSEKSIARLRALSQELWTVKNQIRGGARDPQTLAKFNELTAKLPKVVADAKRSVEASASSFDRIASSTVDGVSQVFIRRSSTLMELNMRMSAANAVDDGVRAIDEASKLVTGVTVPKDMQLVRTFNSAIKKSEQAILTSHQTAQAAWEVSRADLFAKVAQADKLVQGAYTAGQVAINVGKGSLDVLRGAAADSFSTDSYKYKITVNLMSLASNLHSDFGEWGATVIIGYGNVFARSVTLPAADFNADQSFTIYANVERAVDVYLLVRPIPGRDSVSAPLYKLEFSAGAEIAFSDIREASVKYASADGDLTTDDAEEKRKTTYARAMGPIIGLPLYELVDIAEEADRESDPGGDGRGPLSPGPIDTETRHVKFNPEVPLGVLATAVIKVVVGRMAPDPHATRSSDGNGGGDAEDRDASAATTTSTKVIEEAPAGSVPPIAIRTGKVTLRTKADTRAVTGAELHKLEERDELQGSPFEGPPPAKCPPGPFSSAPYAEDPKKAGDPSFDLHVAEIHLSSSHLPKSLVDHRIDDGYVDQPIPFLPHRVEQQLAEIKKNSENKAGNAGGTDGETNGATGQGDVDISESPIDSEWTGVPEPQMHVHSTDATNIHIPRINDLVRDGGEEDTNADSNDSSDGDDRSPGQESEPVTGQLSLQLLCRPTKVPLTDDAEVAFKCMSDFGAVACSGMSSPLQATNLPIKLPQGRSTNDWGKVTESMLHRAIFHNGRGTMSFRSTDSIKRAGVQCEVRTATGRTVGAFRTSVFDMQARTTDPDGYVVVPIYAARANRWPTLLTLFGENAGYARIKVDVGDITSVSTSPATSFSRELAELFKRRAPRKMQDSNAWLKSQSEVRGLTQGHILLDALGYTPTDGPWKNADIQTLLNEHKIGLHEKIFPSESIKNLHHELGKMHISPIIPAPWMVDESRHPGQRTCPSVFTHRGVSTQASVENTLDAVIDGAMLGFEGLEVDVGLIRDADGTVEAILTHDSDLDRILGYAHHMGKTQYTAVETMRFTALRKALSVCGFFPTLGELLFVAKTLGLQADIELKPSHPMDKVFDGYNDLIGDLVGKQIRAMGAEDNVVVSGFDPRKLAKVNAEGNSKIRTAVAEHGDFGSKAIGFANSVVGVTPVSAHIVRWASLDEAMAKKWLQRKRMPLGVYTLYDLNDPDTAQSHSKTLVERTVSLGVSWVESDDPRKVQRDFEEIGCRPRQDRKAAIEQREKILTLSEHQFATKFPGVGVGVSAGRYIQDTIRYATSAKYTSEFESPEQWATRTYVHQNMRNTREDIEEPIVRTINDLERRVNVDVDYVRLKRAQERVTIGERRSTAAEVARGGEDGKKDTASEATPPAA